MSSYESRIPNFVRGKTEEEIRTKLMSIGQQLGQKVEVMSIYPNANNGRLTAWYFHDIKKAPFPKDEAIKKTRRKKKAE